MIVGAGPAGLAMAGRLRKLDIPFQILERSNRIAQSWHGHYDRLCLHTVRDLSGLPHMAIPTDFPKYVPRKELIKYYENYAITFNIKPVFDEEAVSIGKKENEHWEIKCRSRREYHSGFVVVATGASRIPFQPEIAYQERYRGTIIHGKYYKNANSFLNQRVLVIGMGNSGAEIALDLCNRGIEVWISIRGGVNIIPRDVFGRPTQITAKNLAVLPFHLGDWLGNQIRNWVIGDLTQYGIPKLTMSPAKQLRQTGRTPVIDVGTLDRIKSGQIKICPEVIEFTEQGVGLRDGKEMSFDSVIFATGYRPGLPDFIRDVRTKLDDNGVPISFIEEEPYSGLYYLGFNIYELDGILGTICRDSETIAKDILKKLNAGNAKG